MPFERERQVELSIGIRTQQTPIRRGADVERYIYLTEVQDEPMTDLDAAQFDGAVLLDHVAAKGLLQNLEDLLRIAGFFRFDEVPFAGVFDLEFLNLAESFLEGTAGPLLDER